MEVFILYCVMTMGSTQCGEMKKPIPDSITPYQCVHIAMEMMTERFAGKEFHVKKFGCRPKTESS